MFLEERVDSPAAVGPQVDVSSGGGIENTHDLFPVHRRPRHAVAVGPLGCRHDAGHVGMVTTMTGFPDASALVLVEGVSDKVALEALAVRRGRDLVDEGVSIVSIGGAQALLGVLRTIGARERKVRLAGLCDAREESGFRRALEGAELGSGLSRETMERIGFYVCDPDLEGELIRALGAADVEGVLEENGDLGSFVTFQKQPQWQGRPVEAQLHRFFGSSAGKIKYARLLVDALDLDHVPRALDAVLAHVELRG